LPKGSVLFSSRAPIGYCVIAENPISTNQGFKSLVLNENALPEYIQYYLIATREYAKSIASGTTFLELSGSRMAHYPIPLPPLEEQRRIVAKLDVLLGRNKAGRQELSAATQLIKRQRQAVLAQAFSGKLTADWREDNSYNTFGVWDLPSSWKWGVFADAADIVSNLVSPDGVLDLPHIAPNHIESGIPKLLPFNTVRDDGVISPKHLFRPGTIIYSKIRPYLRKVVLVDFTGVCSADMYPIRAKYNSKFLLYWMVSQDFTDLTTEHQGRTVLPKINQVALNKIPTPIPPIDEQAEIARRIEAAFARIDEGEQAIKQAFTLAERLEQATLAKAFRGEL
jgi:type I restriction enzyme S subunit